MLPNFLYIGADKSGSTWIYECLKEHPEVCVPVCKDLQFFERYFNRGLKWYESFFRDCGKAKAIGEVSHNYLFHKEAAKRIFYTIPKVKLIACLREPIERAFSEYLHLIRNGATFSFAEALKQHPELVENGRYVKHLKNYFELFDRKQMLILFYDELQKDPASFIQRIYNFLGVDDRFRPSVLHKRILPDSKPRIRFLAALGHKIALLLREMGYLNLLGKIKSSKFIKNLLYKKLEKLPEMDPSVCEYLYKIYQPELCELTLLLRTNLPQNWLNNKHNWKKRNS